MTIGLSSERNWAFDHIKEGCALGMGESRSVRWYPINLVVHFLVDKINIMRYDSIG